MYFKITKRSLLSALQVVSKAVSANSPLPSLSGIKIDLVEDKIILTASDSDISIQKEIIKNEENKLEIIDKGCIVIEARYLLEIVKKLDSEIINIELIDGLLIKIYTDDNEYIINGIKAINYPAIDFNKPENSFTVDAFELLKTINQTVFATSDKETKPVLCGVNFKCNKNVVECVATDSYRLARRYLNIDKELDFNVTIPRRSLNEVAHSIEKDSKVEIAVNDKKIQFLIDDTLLQSRLIDGAYPETSRLVPNDFKIDMTVNSREILNAIDRASLIKTDGGSFVRLTAIDNNITISSKSNDIGSYNSNLKVETFDGGNFDITFSARYALDAIRSLEANVIQIRFAGEMKPFIITNLDDNSILQLVLPVRTYN